MRKKMYLAAVAMCVMLAAAGCGEKENTAKENTAAEKTEETAETAEAEEDTAGTEAVRKDADGNTRLVSVENMEKYVSLGEYKGVILDKSVAEITDEDVDARIEENLKNSAEKVEDNSAVVQDGDTVTINFVGKKDGVAFDGGTAENYDLLIGSGTMIPGFEEGIIGMKKGETKDLDITFPEDYNNADLAGAETVFQITVQSMKRPPELTDKWVASNTEYKTVEEYRNSVKALLEEDAAQEAENSLRSTAWTTVYTNSEIMEYPQEDIDDAKAEFTRQAQTYADQYKIELETFIESQGMSMEDFEEQSQQYAEAKVKQIMIVQAIMDAEGITLEDEESLKIQNQIVETYGAGDMATLIDRYGQEAVDQTIGLMRVQDFIINNANVEKGMAAASEKAGESEETEASEDTEES